MAIVRRGPGGLELPDLFRRFFSGEPSGLTSGWLPVEEYRDGDELVDLVYKYYPQLDAKYKGLIPLRQVYIPETLTE